MPQPTWALFLTMSIPLCPPCTHPLMATSSRIMHHVNSKHFKSVSWTWQWVHCTKMAPTVTRSQANRASLGCDGTCPGSWMCIPQISINCKMLSYQYGPTFLMLSAPCWINATLRQFWRRKGVKHSISMVFLIIL